jgi:hypothetical protein
MQRFSIAFCNPLRCAGRLPQRANRMLCHYRHGERSFPHTNLEMRVARFAPSAPPTSLLKGADRIVFRVWDLLRGQNATSPIAAAKSASPPERGHPSGMPARLLRPPRAHAPEQTGQVCGNLMVGASEFQQARPKKRTPPIIFGHTLKADSCIRGTGHLCQNRLLIRWNWNQAQLYTAISTVASASIASDGSRGDRDGDTR